MAATWMSINRWMDIDVWNIYAVAAAAKSLQSCPALCDPTDGSPLGSSVPVILQARILEWKKKKEYWSGLPFPFPMHESESEVAQSCRTLSDPMDCSLPGFSVHVIFQARVLEWGAIAFSVEHIYWAEYYSAHIKKESASNATDLGLITGWKDPLEKEMAIHSSILFFFFFHSSILAWRITGTEEPSGLPSVGSHRVGHD